MRCGGAGTLMRWARRCWPQRGGGCGEDARGAPHRGSVVPSGEVLRVGWWPRRWRNPPGGGATRGSASGRVGVEDLIGVLVADDDLVGRPSNGRNRTLGGQTRPSPAGATFLHS